MRSRSYVGLAALITISACSAQTNTTLPAGRQVKPAAGSPIANVARLPSPSSLRTPAPGSSLIVPRPDGPHSFGDLEGGINGGRPPAPYIVAVSGVYPPFVIDASESEVVAGNNVSFSSDNLTCSDNELDATGNANGSRITAAALDQTNMTPNTSLSSPTLATVNGTNTFAFTLTLGLDNISPPTQFGCRFYFQDSKQNVRRITMYAGGPAAHPMTITPNTIQLSGSYPFVNSPTQTITVSEPDPNNAFNFGRTGLTFDGTPLCSSVDGTDIGECRSAALLTYDVNVAGAGASNPPPHLLLQNLGPANNHSLTLTYAGVAPQPVGSVTTMMIWDASGDYAPITVRW